MNYMSERYYRNPLLKGVIFDSFSIVDTTSQQRFQTPVVTKHCHHPKYCTERQIAIEQIQQNKSYQCSICGKIAYNENELIQDWRCQAYQEFNLYNNEISVIRGIMVNKYIRNKTRYQNFFMEEICGNEFLNLFERMNQEQSINYLIKSQLINSQNQNNKIQFWSFCLLDRVKITIPVRILGCKHLECYELTSLLFYQHQNNKKKQFLECTQPGCSNRLKIAHKNYTLTEEETVVTEEDKQNRILDVQTLFSGICIDFDLLNAIKRSNPSSCKFYYNMFTQQIEEDVIKDNNGRLIDPLIQKYYQKNIDVQSKFKFEDFSSAIQQQVIVLSQGDMLQEDKQLSKQLALYKYRNYSVKMQDKLTDMIIEYPVRCKFCTELSVCMDMRSYIADFTYQKKMYPYKSYTCPLCNTQYKSVIVKSTIQSFIYLDSNMLSYMFKDMSYTQGTKIFEYKGEQYMRQEFMDRQKIRREDYIANLQYPVEFKQLFCTVNPNLRIKEPLVLSKCPYKSMIDFQSFYDQLKRIDFDIETKGLKLCECQFCNLNPIKSIPGNIHFHEPFYEALNKFYGTNYSTNLQTFSYKFEKTQEESYVLMDQVQDISPKIKVLQQNKYVTIQKPPDFIDLMDDEGYQRLFSTQQIQGFAFRAQFMEKNNGVLEIGYYQDGIRANLKEAAEKMHRNASAQLIQFNFKIVRMRMQLRNDILIQNKGELYYEE